MSNSAINRECKMQFTSDTLFKLQDFIKKFQDGKLFPLRSRPNGLREI